MSLVKKLGAIIFLLLLLVLFIPSKSNAAGATGLNVTPSTIIKGAENFISSAEDRDIFDADAERTSIDLMYNILLAVGIVGAIFVGFVLGIQLVTSGAAGQAKVKEKLIPYAVGTFVMFGAFGIWKLVYNILNGFFK